MEPGSVALRVYASNLETTPLNPPLVKEEISGESSDRRLLRAKFEEFAAGVFYRQWIAAMRKSLAEKPLIHGGKAEEIFKAQLDQTLAEKIATSNGGSLVGELFEHWIQGAASAATETYSPNDERDERQLRESADGPAQDPV